MATTPNFNWSTPDNTGLVKNGALDIRTLGNSIDSSMADLKGGTTGQVLKKATNTDMDFVWSADSAGMTNPMTTTGDTIYSSSGSTPARLGIGSTGQVLTVAGGLPSWATPAASGGGMTLISTTSLSGASTTIGSISGSYNSLYAVIYGVTWTGSSDAIVCRPNAATTGTDSNSFYSYGTTVANTATPDNAMFVSYLAGTVSSNANSFVLQIDNYASTASFKPYQSYGQILHVGGSRGTVSNVGGYRSTSAITSLEFAVNTSGTSFTAGTVLLYGVK